MQYSAALRLFNIHYTLYTRLLHASRLVVRPNVQLVACTSCIVYRIQGIYVVRH
jgi:hypothetical protein